MGIESRSREWDGGVVVGKNERCHTVAKRDILDWLTSIFSLKNKKISPVNFNKLRTGKQFL